MRQPIFFTLLCTLLLAAGSDAFSSERGDRDNRHRHNDKSEHRVNKKHHNKHHRKHSHRSHHQDRRHKHRRNNDAAVFIGGAILGATLNSHYNNDHRHSHRNGHRSVSNSYSYRRDRRGDCFRVEYNRGREIWYAVPRRQCQAY